MHNDELTSKKERRGPYIVQQLVEIPVAASKHTKPISLIKAIDTLNSCKVCRIFLLWEIPQV